MALSVSRVSTEEREEVPQAVPHVLVHALVRIQVTDVKFVHQGLVRVVQVVMHVTQTEPKIVRSVGYACAKPDTLVSHVVHVHQTI